MPSRTRAARSNTWSAQTFYCILHFMHMNVVWQSSCSRYKKIIRATNIHRNFWTPELISNAEIWRNTTEVSLFQRRTKWSWSWVNYVWLHLHSSQRRMKRLLWLCGYGAPKLISLSVTRWLSLYRSLPRMLQLYTQLQYHTSCPSTSQQLFWNIFLEILWANYVLTH